MRYLPIGQPIVFAFSAKLGTVYDRHYMPGADLTQWDPLFRTTTPRPSSTS
jgi:hypothetical protein